MSSTIALALATLVWPTHALIPGPQEGVLFSRDAVPVSGFDAQAEHDGLWSKYFPTKRLNKRHASNPAKQEGSANAKLSKDVYHYVIPTIIGNQSFQMMLNTGSAHLWARSNNVSNKDPDGTYYVPSPSAHQLSNYTWNITYASNITLSGIVYTDVVKVGPVVAETQAVELATHVPRPLPFNGIIGLKLSSENLVKPVKQTTFFEAVAPTLKMVFNAYIRPKGNATWDFGTVILDSGSSHIYLPETVITEYYRHVPGHEVQFGWNVFPCNQKLPDVNFKIEGKVFKIYGRDIRMNSLDPSYPICAIALENSIGGKYNISGTWFMQNYYIVRSLEGDVATTGLTPQSP